MSARRLFTMDVHALIRRLRAGESERRIAVALRLDRKTVRRYHRWAKQQGLLRGAMPELAALEAQLRETYVQTPRRGNVSSVEPWRDEVQTLLDKGLGPKLIFQKLSQRSDFNGSESAVWRMTRKLRPAMPEATVRVETPPGEEAQVDFGAVGKLFDPITQSLRKAWVFVMVLSWSRHMYVEFVFDQTVETWLELHRRAFEFFGGVAGRLVIDNLKAGILKASVEDPKVQRAYPVQPGLGGECAEHYGFLIAPCRPRTPQHKGKVERGGVAYPVQPCCPGLGVKGSFVPLLPENCALAEANRLVHEWVLTTAGNREHGTTHVAPLLRFLETECAVLQALPATPYDPAVWKQAKLHRDCHPVASTGRGVVFEKSFYSAPFRQVGQKLWLRASTREIRLFSDDFELVATHTRATTPGQRLTNLDHLPPEKVPGLQTNRERFREQARAIGPTTAEVVTELLAERPVDRTRTVGRILRLAEQFSPARLEAACQRGQAFGDCKPTTLRRILERELEQSPLPVLPTHNGGTLVFARSAQELGAAILQAAASPATDDPWKSPKGEGSPERERSRRGGAPWK